MTYDVHRCGPKVFPDVPSVVQRVPKVGIQKPNTPMVVSFSPFRLSAAAKRAVGTETEQVGVSETEFPSEMRRSTSKQRE